MSIYRDCVCFKVCIFYPHPLYEESSKSTRQRNRYQIAVNSVSNRDQTAIEPSSNHYQVGSTKLDNRPGQKIEFQIQIGAYKLVGKPIGDIS